MEDFYEPIKIKTLSPNARLPTKSTIGSSGFDLYSIESIVVPAASHLDGRVSIGRALIATGISAAIPSGCVGKIGSRSGLSVHNNIEVGAGWIDPDYRGEIKVELKNMSSEDFLVNPGMRIAQLFILRVANVALETIDILPPSERGEKGFGSSGI